MCKNLGYLKRWLSDWDVPVNRFLQFIYHVIRSAEVELLQYFSRFGILSCKLTNWVQQFRAGMYPSFDGKWRACVREVVSDSFMAQVLSEKA